MTIVTREPVRVEPATAIACDDGEPHRWERVLHGGQLVRVECAACHRTPIEAVEQLPARPPRSF